MTAIIILCSLILSCLVVSVVFNILLYNRVVQLLSMNGAYQAEEYRKAVGVKRQKIPFTRSPAKENKRGRKIEPQDDLVDMSDVPWEEGYKAIAEIDNGS